MSIDDLDTYSQISLSRVYNTVSEISDQRRGESRPSSITEPQSQNLQTPLCSIPEAEALHECPLLWTPPRAPPGARGKVSVSAPRSTTSPAARVGVRTTVARSTAPTATRVHVSVLAPRPTAPRAPCGGVRVSTPRITASPDARATVNV